MELLTFKRIRIPLFVYFLLAILEGSTILFRLFQINLAKAAASFTRISTTHLVEMALLGILILLMVLAVISLFVRENIWKNLFNRIESRQDQFRVIAPLALAVLNGIYLLGIFVMDKVIGTNSESAFAITNYLSAIIFFFLLQTIFLFVLIKRQLEGTDFARFFLITLGIIFAVWLFVILTGIGIIPDDRYWNVAGVPVMAKQLSAILIFVLLLDSLLSFIQKRRSRPIQKVPLWVDVIICLSLWIGAAYLWNQAPFGHSFFANGPYPPNNEFVPYSDSAMMDLGGQYMLIGEGLDYPFFTEKTLYVFFLGVLHFIVGPSYAATTSLQIVIFAIFPILLYLLGKKFNGRILGIALALFGIAKEQNALISTFKISVSNSRLYMTEFPTAILMLALALVLFLWFRNPNKKLFLILIAGGVLGFSTLIRTNPLLLFPIVVVLILLDYHFDWKKWFYASLIFLTGFILAIGPWIAYDQIKYGTNTYTSKIDAVIKLRFLNQKSSPAPTGVGFRDDFLLNFNQPSPKTASTDSDANNQSDQSTTLSKIQIVAGHFLNNEIKSLFVIPFQLYPQEYDSILSEAYWKEPIIWKGDLPISAVAAFALNLGLIAFGIMYAWKRWRIGGLVPLIIQVGYYFSNALGRTSGSRYLLPVDWVPYFYFLTGILFLVQWIGSCPSYFDQADTPCKEVPAKIKSQKLLPGLLISGIVILILGSSIPVVNSAFPKRYPVLSDQQLLEQLNASQFSQNTEISQVQITEFLSQPNAVLYFGRLLYPRKYYISDENRDGLLFTLLTPEIHEVFLPQNNLIEGKVDESADVYILGCQKDGYIKAYVTYFVDSNTVIDANPSFGQIEKITKACSTAD
jgi:hypothetical protein